MLWQIPLFLMSTLVFLFISMLLAEAAWSPLNASAKTRLQLAVKRVAAPRQRSLNGANAVCCCSR